MASTGVKAAAAAEAERAEKEINYLKIALYIILFLAVLTGVLLYFRKQDKSLLESKIVPPERKEEQPIDNANTEPTNFEETNEDEKK